MFNKVPKSISFELVHIIFISSCPGCLEYTLEFYLSVTESIEQKHRTKSNLSIQDNENYLTKPEISFFYAKLNEILLYSRTIFAKIRPKME